MRKYMLIPGFLFAAGSAIAQARPVKDLPDNVLKAGGAGIFNDGQAILVPTGIMHFSVTGSVWDEAKGSGGAKAQSHAKFLTDGLDRAMLQDIARNIVNDLVTRLRAAGYRVLTWDDIRSDPELAGWDHPGDDEDWGMPTSGRNGREFATLGPSDAQQWTYPIQGPGWKFRGIARSRNVAVVIPEYWFNSPDIRSNRSGGYKRASISVEADPSLRMAPARIWLINPKATGGMLQLNGLGYLNFMVDSVGTVALVKTDKWKPSFLSRVSANFTLEVDRTLYADAALLHAATFNQAVAKVAAKERK